MGPAKRSNRVAWLVVGTAAGVLSADASSLNWKEVGGARVAALSIPAAGKTGFSLLPSEVTGIHFINKLSEQRAMNNVNLMNGSGVALGDYDGDGLCDIYLCNLNGTNALYKNLGNWKFKDVTQEAGVACPNQTSTGAVFADVNGDGRLDLLVTSMGGPNACFLNDGHGHFANATAAAGLVSKLGSTSMALADMDGNGTLDLYVANYGATSILRSGGALNLSYVNGREVVRGRYAQRIKIVDGMMLELGEPDVLYLNDGKGKFTPVSWTDGTFLDEEGRPLAQAPWDQGLSVLCRDINGDGAPDIYVCNDAFTPDRCWINDGRGHFRALNHLALRSTSYFSMGADFADLDRDGYDDFLVVDMLSRQHRFVLTQKGEMYRQPRLPGGLDSQLQMRRNTLFLNRGDGTYAEIANFSGVAGSEWSWSCLFLDVDLDGWEDLLVSNGFAHNVDDLDTQQRIKRMANLSVDERRRTLLLYPPLATPNVAFRNQHNLTFLETGREWGFDSPQISNGMALADLDNDGDLDVVINCLNGPVLVYRNETTAPRLAVRLRGESPNTQGIGAKIKVYGGPITQSQEVICGGRYMSGDDPMRVFAAGSLTNEMRIEVQWRSGKRSVVNGVKANRIYEVEEAGANAKGNIQHPTFDVPQPVFEDVSQLLRHTHHEEAFDDFERQPLLGRKLSQLGPGVGWYDVDGDGWEDLLVGSGRGGSLAVYRNDGHGGFQPMTGAPLKQIATRDQTSVLGWTKGPGQTVILAGSANYEDGLAAGASMRQYDLAGRTMDDTFPAQASSTGPLALGDLSGTGHLSLFVGGRVVAGRWPEAASSMIFRWENGKWERDEENTRCLAGVGLVSGAVFSDLDGDGKPELLLACEWGPVRVFHNEDGQLKEVTQPFGLSGYTGWWNGVTTGDLDGDGRMDIVAGNWGQNTRYQSHRAKPLRVYYGDLDGNGTVESVQAYYDVELKKVVPEEGLDFVAKGMPFVRERFPTHRAYAEASMEEILGDRMKAVKELEASTLESMVFLNRGDHFEARALPAEAQWAPAFAVCVGDYDGDGKEDVFLSQNFFAVNPENWRCDAGRGLWLRGDGKGNLVAVPGQQSGIQVYGEQRGAALCDYDGDGRIDLVVTQNGAETRLYHNVGARPGLRVRLKGPAGNPRAVGAQMRLSFGQRQGPVREIHAGSGYWSEDSAVQVLGTPEQPTQLQVRWPGGKSTTNTIPQAAKEIMVDSTGELEVVR